MTASRSETALHAAAWYGFAAIVELLLARGADPNAEAGRPFGGRPLDWAERCSREADHDVLGRSRAGVDYDATEAHLVMAGAEQSR
jgi:ankyrin repeat protein